MAPPIPGVAGNLDPNLVVGEVNDGETPVARMGWGPYCSRLIQRVLGEACQGILSCEANKAQKVNDITAFTKVLSGWGTQEERSSQGVYRHFTLGVCQSHPLMRTTGKPL